MNLIFDAIKVLCSSATWRWQFRMWEFYGKHNTGAIKRLGAIGRGTHIEPTAKLTDPENIFLGSHCHINHLVCLQPGTAKIRIGDDLLCGPGTMLFATNYKPGAGILRESEWIAQDITIGNDVWLGAGVVITAGVTIGDHTIVAAGSVVTKSLPAGMIAAGIPAKSIRPRPGFESITELRNDIRESSD
ncbi:acyltransferase [Roseiconus lacunae]|uniref:DapH/DapD/GlmU-related protein n=1 Tax=Roseiconus lacunae TaxID=2605694 RepID=A0ABT7PR71_9BACT|nr:DapH/DapD/GlmU-related protein [Roseiconus lacunae]MDM4018836.1 DapH/DapD/GlmU-related protein [Roseiconus lacunae]